MQKIKLKKDLIDKVFSGKKRATTRRGIKDYTLGDVKFVTPDGTDPYPYSNFWRITELYILDWDSVRLDHSLAQKEGYTHSGELANALISIYGENFEGDDFTVVHFEPV